MVEFSVQTQEAQAALDHCLELKRRLEARQPELTRERPAAEARYAELRLRLLEQGQWDEAGRQQARVESGLLQVEEDLAGIAEALRNFPVLLAQKTEAAARAAQKDKERALEGLQKRLRTIIRKDVLPAVRGIEKALPEIESTCLSGCLSSILRIGVRPAPPIEAPIGRSRDPCTNSQRGLKSSHGGLPPIEPEGVLI